jgi:polyisoprenoid-binding protein YceI
MFQIKSWIGFISLISIFLAACSAPVAPQGAAVAPTATSTPIAEAAAEETTATETSTETSPEASPAELRTFRIVPEQSEASYEVEEEFFGRAVRFVTAIGRTNTIEGELALEINENQVQLGDNRFVVDLRTLTSDSGQRDRRIRGEWLQSNTYPFAEFTATEVRNFPSGAAESQDVQFELAGNMNIREITQPLVFDTLARIDGDTLSVTAVTFLYMRDFGFEPPNILGMLAVTDGVTVTVQLTAQAD